MREIAYSEIADAVCGLCIEANTILPADLRCAIEGARAAEASPVGRAILGDLVENYTFAAEKASPSARTRAWRWSLRSWARRSTSPADCWRTR